VSSLRVKVVILITALDPKRKTAKDKKDRREEGINLTTGWTIYKGISFFPRERAQFRKSMRQSTVEKKIRNPSRKIRIKESEEEGKTKTYEWNENMRTESRKGYGVWESRCERKETENNSNSTRGPNPKATIEM
jgi:hypothetical protein